MSGTVLCCVGTCKKYFRSERTFPTTSIEVSSAGIEPLVPREWCALARMKPSQRQVPFGDLHLAESLFTSRQAGLPLWAHVDDGGLTAR